MNKILAALTATAIILCAGVASAHMFWINLTEARNHEPAHVLTALGFGHALPLDDFLAGQHGVIRMAKYEVVNPDMKKEDLGLPDDTPFQAKQTPLKLAIAQGDLGLRKIILSAGAQQGTYQVSAESVPMFIAKYVNTKGKERMAPKPLDELKDLKQPIASFKYQSFAKSYFTIGEWTTPAPMGHELEIVPSTDLSNVHAGDVVEFTTYFKGQPVESNNQAIRYLTCSSNTFGSPDGFNLSAPVIHGKGTFRIPTAGQWVANIFYSEKVADNPNLSELNGKCIMVYTAASVFFNVKP